MGDHSYHNNKKMQVLTNNPYRILAFGFALVMFIGSLLLSLPIAVQDGVETSYVDALFTSVSCVAVTGLSVVDTYRHWSIFGQIVMGILIQLGGLGIMTFTTMIAAIMGRRIGLRDRINLQETMGQSGIKGLVRLVVRIVKYTMAIEFVGGIVYSIQLYKYLGISSIYYGFLQSVSSFCNAGFVFFDNDLPYKMVGDPLFNINTCVLIILGGIGFVVIFDVIKNFKRGFSYYSLHSKIMLISTAAILVVSFALIMILEWSNPYTMGHLSIIDKIQAGVFQAVTPRTAGLSTLNYEYMHANTLFLTMVLMFIGAGSGSTAGGVKLTTMVVVFMASINIFRGRKELYIFERKITHSTVYRCMSMIFFSFFLIVIATFFMATLENISFIRLLFEVTSAFGTVGLSTGITGDLTPYSKWLLIFVMYSGRVGVLTLLGSFAMRNKSTSRISYPEGHIIV